jgi:hypothetical protein
MFIFIFALGQIQGRAMAGCQLAFGQWTRVTKTCECMVLVQFVPV